jgi:glycosyltransferase involved in cell wall biosynthesis
MRVVFLTHNYPRHPGDLAGAFLHPLALALRARGHQIAVVAPSDQGRGGSHSIDGIPVARVRYGSPERERYAYTGRLAEAVRSPAGWWALARLIRGMRRAARSLAAGGAASGGTESGGVDCVVHAHWWFPSGLAAPPELPTVVTLHGTDVRLLERAWARPFARRALRAGRTVTVVSRPLAAAAARVTGTTAAAMPIEPMPLSLDPHRSAGGGGLVVIGRLTLQKRFHLALAAHQALQRERPGLRLTVVGEGPERPRLENLAAELGTSSTVTFAGQVPPPAVSAAIDDADVCLFPAHAEGFGLAALEALAAGVPVVACRDGGGVLDILQDSDAGLVVDPTPDALAVATRTLLDGPGSREAAARAGAAWRDRLAPSRVAERYEAVYRQALFQRPSRG